MQSFKVASALTAFAASAGFNIAVGVNKTIMEEQPFVRCIKKRKKTVKEGILFKMSFSYIRELGFLGIQSLRGCMCL